MVPFGKRRKTPERTRPGTPIQMIVRSGGGAKHRRFIFFITLLIIPNLLFFINILSNEERFRRALTHAVQSAVQSNGTQNPTEIPVIDCSRIFSNDRDYIKAVSKRRRRHVKDDPKLDMSCEAVRSRTIGNHFFPSVGYPIAFARNVYTDYEFLESQVSINYNRDNHFCFSIDKKASKEFHSRMRTMAGCIGNVHITNQEWNLDSAGHFTNHAHLECLRLLSQTPSWNYVILLQNHDVMIKTNAQLAEIFRILNGTMDVRMTGMMWSRIDRKLKWDLNSLGFFKNETPLSENERKEAKLEFVKGMSSASLHRDTVDWMVNKVNLEKLMEQINKKNYGIDEILLNTLANSETLKMPGGYHSKCFKKRKDITVVTRRAFWSHVAKCKSGKSRHQVCIMGVEDLLTLESLPDLAVNKFMPNFDQTAIQCIVERIHERTASGHADINRTFYEQLPEVRYNRHKFDKGFDIENFEC